MPSRKTRLLVALALALVVASCAGVWLAIRAPQRLFLVPGAADIQVSSLGLATQLITYHAPGPPYTWYYTVVRNLSAEGWSAPVVTRAGIRNTPEIHWRISSWWLIYIKEEVGLQGEPDFARITVRREIIIPWRQYLP